MKLLNYAQRRLEIPVGGLFVRVGYKGFAIRTMHKEANCVFLESGGWDNIMQDTNVIYYPDAKLVTGLPQ